MIRMHQPWIIGIALLATACDAPVGPARSGPVTPTPLPGALAPSPGAPEPSPESPTIHFMVALRSVARRCTVETTPADRTPVQKHNNPTLVWHVKPVDCWVNAQLQIRDWTRYPVLPSGLCDMSVGGIPDDPTEPTGEKLSQREYAAKVRADAKYGCYKYTVYFNDKVQQDPELEIVP
jgi:hypothetical protein